MGYLIAPDIKDEDVLCQKPCTHSDCAAMRRDFIDNPNCKVCGKPIEIGQAFYYNEQGKTDKVHYFCEINR